MIRSEALEILNQNVSNQNLIKHSLAVEAVMRALARHFGESEEKWAMAGLLHDIDYEKIKDNPVEHSLIGAKMLQDLGIDEDICQAVKVHNEVHGISAQTLMEKSLFAADPLTGLIVAAALVLPNSPSGGPSKKLKELSLENVLNRFKEKSFAKGANREIIKKCEEYLNLSLGDFIKISLEAMQGIDNQLGI